MPAIKMKTFLLCTTQDGLLMNNNITLVRSERGVIKIGRRHRIAISIRRTAHTHSFAFNCVRLQLKLWLACVRCVYEPYENDLYICGACIRREFYLRYPAYILHSCVIKIKLRSFVWRMQVTNAIRFSNHHNIYTKHS